MGENKRNTIAVMAVLLFGFALFYAGTDGFRAFTAESARTYDINQSQPAFPDVTLEDSKERTYTFDEFAEGKYVFVTFMYTNCTTVCPQLEMNMAQVYEQIPNDYIGEDIVFLSISFDPEHDDPETLSKYRTYFGSNGETWRMARIHDKEELNTVLDKLGVIVIPDGNGDFTHNSAFYLIGKSGHLLEMMDFTLIDEAADEVNRLLESEEGA
ncbi:SCO family protein [Lentibacillus salicampi]|uniref:SCO family protein n=1 Tax=Lentibacillus salicampi TaxID=175306 RepID=A0A4Y9AF18_9BACI|nr:SCO family protein [Lentibacillus salicampi]TFJ93560.1 SCO family protein [Lentibacillus salicampi]